MTHHLRKICSGKTTFARALAEKLGLPFVELDSLHWGPNWAEPTAEEFRARGETFLSRDSLFLWVLRTHHRRQRQLSALECVRLRSPKEADAWLEGFVPAR